MTYDMLWDKACPGQPRSFQPDMEKKFPETTHPSGCGDGYKSVPVSIISDNMFCNSFLIDIYGFLRRNFVHLKISEIDYKFSYSISKTLFDAASIFQTN